MLQIDRSLKEPVFRQIAGQLENLILTGELAPGAKLPTERYLASLLQVHRSTVTTAYEDLRSHGLIQSKQGSGNYIRDELWDFAPNSPHWQSYIRAGGFRPTQPLMQKIRDISLHPEFINFADGELAPELLPHALLEQVLKTQPVNRWLGYSDYRGELYLRNALSDHLKAHHGIHAGADRILVTSGTQQSLHLISQCLLSQGDCIGIEGPSYFYAIPNFISAGIRLIRIPSDAEGIIPESIPDLYRKYRIKMLMLTPTYHNPTGTVLSVARRRKLLEICSDLRIVIVEDDVYGAISLRGSEAPPPPLSAMEQPHGQGVIYLGSLSKTTASGIRMGWIVGTPSVLDRLADVKQQMDFGTSTLLQQIIEPFLASGAWEEQLNLVRDVLTGNRDVMLDALRRYWGDAAEWTNPQGGYHVWCRLKRKVMDTELLEQAIRKKVIYVPGSMYGAEEAGYVRLSYARISQAAIVEGIRRLSEII